MERPEPQYSRVRQTYPLLLRPPVDPMEPEREEPKLRKHTHGPHQYRHEHQYEYQHKHSHQEERHPHQHPHVPQEKEEPPPPCPPLPMTVPSLVARLSFTHHEVCIPVITCTFSYRYQTSLRPHTRPSIILPVNNTVWTNWSSFSRFEYLIFGTICPIGIHTFRR